MEVLRYIQDYISLTYDNKADDCISRLLYSDYTLVLELTIKQIHNFKTESYINCKYYRKTGKLTDFIIDDTNNDEHPYPMLTLYLNNITHIKLLSHVKLQELLLLNKDKKYIFIPITLKDETEETGHICLLIFDLNLNIVLFFDPNGPDTYYFVDDKFDFINKLFNKYINTFNQLYNTRFSFVPQTDWVQQDYNLNTDTIGKEGDFNYNSGGHCLSITLIMAHLLSATDKDINTIIIELSKLSPQEKIDMVMGYIENTYNILDKEKKEQHQLYRLIEMIDMELAQIDLEREG